MDTSLTEEKIIDLMIENERMRQKIAQIKEEKNKKISNQNPNSNKIQICIQQVSPIRFSIPILPIPSEYT